MAQQGSMGGTRLACIKLVVDDLEAAARFYAGVFDMKQLERIRVDTGIRHTIDEIILTAGGDPAQEAALILLKYLGKEAPRPSDHILCFTVPDLAHALVQAQVEGGRVLRQPQQVREGGPSMAIATDNGGNLLEIVQMPEAGKEAIG